MRAVLFDLDGVLVDRESAADGGAPIAAAPAFCAENFDALRLEVDPWMVGDSRYDREAARSGVFFVGLGIAGDLCIDELADLIGILRERAGHSP